jgi:hypothetical protein
MRLHGGGQGFEPPAVHQLLPGKVRPASRPQPSWISRLQPVDKQTGCGRTRLGQPVTSLDLTHRIPGVHL